MVDREGLIMASTIKDILPRMFALAHERSELSRVQLAGMLADIFLHNDEALSLREEELINELIDQLMFHSTPKVREQLVEKFADVTRMPRRIAVGFAQDLIETARPILISCPSLTEEDLVRIIEIKGCDHATAVAQRAHIRV